VPAMLFCFLAGSDILQAIQNQNAKIFVALAKTFLECIIDSVTTHDL